MLRLVSRTQPVWVIAIAFACSSNDDHASGTAKGGAGGVGGAKGGAGGAESARGGADISGGGGAQGGNAGSSVRAESGAGGSLEGGQGGAADGSGGSQMGTGGHVALGSGGANGVAGSLTGIGGIGDAGANAAGEGGTIGGSPGSLGGSSGAGGGQTTACTIGSVAYADGALNPLNPCEACVAATSATMWSTLPDGRGCAPGSQCATGSCTRNPVGPCDVNVPGDYASVQQAITALRDSDTKATVCVAKGTYAGDIAGTYGDAELTIAGASAASVILDGHVSIPDYSGAPALIRFRGVTITKGLDSRESVAFESCIVRGTTNAISVSTPTGGPLTTISLTIDGCDVSATNGAAVSLGYDAYDNNPRGIQATLRNNYIHDAPIGLSIHTQPYQSYRASGKVTALHNTFDNDQTGLVISASGVSLPTTQFVGNLIIESDLGIRSNRPVMTSVDDFRDNALFANITNYADSAVPGTGYVTADPKLTPGAPPAPGAGSPLINAGDATLVPSGDYFGSPRNGRADIGAVQGP